MAGRLSHPNWAAAWSKHCIRERDENGLPSTGSVCVSFTRRSSIGSMLSSRGEFVHRAFEREHIGSLGWCAHIARRVSVRVNDIDGRVDVGARIHARRRLDARDIVRGGPGGYFPPLVRKRQQTAVGGRAKLQVLPGLRPESGDGEALIASRNQFQRSSDTLRHACDPMGCADLDLSSRKHRRYNGKSPAPDPGRASIAWRPRPWCPT